MEIRPPRPVDPDRQAGILRPVVESDVPVSDVPVSVVPVSDVPVMSVQ